MKGPPLCQCLYAGALPPGPDCEGKWTGSQPLFAAGAERLDLYFEFQAPARAAATLITPRFEWYLELEPAQGEGWFQETHEHFADDGTRSEQRKISRLGDIIEDAVDPAAALVFRQQATTPINARRVRVVFRGWVGQNGAVKILALAR